MHVTLLVPGPVRTELPDALMFAGREAHPGVPGSTIRKHTVCVSATPGAQQDAGGTGPTSAPVVSAGAARGGGTHRRARSGCSSARPVYLPPAGAECCRLPAQHCAPLSASAGFGAGLSTILSKRSRVAAERAGGGIAERSTGAGAGGRSAWAHMRRGGVAGVWWPASVGRSAVDRSGCDVCGAIGFRRGRWLARPSDGAHQ